MMKVQLVLKLVRIEGPRGELFPDHIQGPGTPA
jgi:hypothetical protein